LFLDTDILSYLLANNEAVIDRVAAWRDGQPAITAKETLFNEFLRTIRVYSLDDEAIRIAADSYGALNRIGKPRSNTDILLAAIVMRNGGTRYTNNIRHFEPIPHLKLLR
jgi:predicted nucleic acid-binding protein